MNPTTFEVTTAVTRESCRAQATARLGHHLREILVVVAMLGLGTAILHAIHSDKTQLMAIALAVAAAYALFAIPLTAARLYASRNAAVDSIWLSFEEEGVSVSTKVEESWLEYGQVTQLWENSRYVMICVRHHTPLVFRKSEVLGQRAEELKAFLKEKTGREFRPFRG